jgi:hypothetical protein
MPDIDDKDLSELMAAVRLEQARADNVDSFVEDVFDDVFKRMNRQKTAVEDIDITPKD